MRKLSILTLKCTFFLSKSIVAARVYKYKVSVHSTGPVKCPQYYWGYITLGPLLQNILFICWTQFFFFCLLLFCNRWSLNLFCNNSNRKRMRFPLKIRGETIDKTCRTKVLPKFSRRVFLRVVLKFAFFCNDL